MKVIIKARHMNLTPALRAYAEEKLSDALERVLDRPAARMDIELCDLGHHHVKTGTKECRVTVQMPRAKPITISDVHEDMYGAIDLTHDRLLHAVKRECARQRGTTQQRKFAARNRRATARATLTAGRERWEREVHAYENSV